MQECSMPSTDSPPLPDHLDVLIVGAGISGINAAYHLSQSLPHLRFAVVESHESFGGTWFVHTYPGVRTDTEAYTLGYDFKPWTGAPYAGGGEILAYLGEVLDEFSLHDHFFFGRKVMDASWSSETQRWTVSGRANSDSQGFSVSTKFIWMCHGYYQHEKGYTPDWDGLESFAGQVVHPQAWPTDIELHGKNVALIGSGATMATLAPSIADDCKSLTVIQRSPTYFFQSPNVEPLADQLRSLGTPEEWIHWVVRKKSVNEMQTLVQIQQMHAEISRRTLIDMVAKQLPDGYDIETHFTPRHMPQDQRVCRVLDGDLFQKISTGKIEMVTDEIERFTPTSIVTKGGAEVPCDVVITATGFNLSVLGGVRFVVDGDEVNFANSTTYRGLLFTGLPNLAWTFGALRLSWTMRADYVSRYVCRLLAHLEEHGFGMVLPALRESDMGMEIHPFIDPDKFSPGYAMRSQHLMPKAGSAPEWSMDLDFWGEREILETLGFEDGCLTFEASKS